MSHFLELHILHRISIWNLKKTNVQSPKHIVRIQTYQAEFKNEINALK